MMGLGHCRASCPALLLPSTPPRPKSCNPSRTLFFTTKTVLPWADLIPKTQILDLPVSHDCAPFSYTRPDPLTPPHLPSTLGPAILKKTASVLGAGFLGRCVIPTTNSLILHVLFRSSASPVPSLATPLALSRFLRLALTQPSVLHPAGPSSHSLGEHCGAIVSTAATLRRQVHRGNGAVFPTAMADLGIFRAQ